MLRDQRSPGIKAEAGVQAREDSCIASTTLIGHQTAYGRQMGIETSLPIVDAPNIEAQ